MNLVTHAFYDYAGFRRCSNVPSYKSHHHHVLPEPSTTYRAESASFHLCDGTFRQLLDQQLTVVCSYGEILTITPGWQQIQQASSKQPAVLRDPDVLQHLERHGATARYKSSSLSRYEGVRPGQRSELVGRMRVTRSSGSKSHREACCLVTGVTFF